ncbi:hypothetical protein VP01_666g2, partial [Puccinia sorghi]
CDIYMSLFFVKVVISCYDKSEFIGVIIFNYLLHQTQVLLNISNTFFLSFLQPSMSILDSGSSSHMVERIHFGLKEKGPLSFDSNIVSSFFTISYLFPKSLNNALFLDGHYESNLPVSLGHVSFCFVQTSIFPSKPFKELHFDLIGPVTPQSHRNHKYILKIVNTNTRFVAAVPIVSKAEILSTLSYIIEIESKRFVYYPSILHSDCRNEFKNVLAERFNSTLIESLRTVMLDSSLQGNLWSEVLSTCTLALNQIPTHKIKKSPFELFKGSTIPLEFFKPISDFGKLVGLNTKLKLYHIRLEDGRLVNSKSVKFLDFNTKNSELPDYEELLESLIKMTNLLNRRNLTALRGLINFNQQIPEETFGRILRERILQIKPIKCSHLTVGYNHL